MSNEITFDKSEHIEDPIACITSSAELIASFILWISACQKIQECYIIKLLHASG